MKEQSSIDKNSLNRVLTSSAILQFHDYSKIFPAFFTNFQVWFSIFKCDFCILWITFTINELLKFPDLLPFSMVFSKIKKFHNISLTGKGPIKFSSVVGTLFKRQPRNKKCDNYVANVNAKRAWMQRPLCFSDLTLNGKYNREVQHWYQYKHDSAFHNYFCHIHAQLS